MTKAPEFAPGTVSKILWHFTGGPRWNEKTKKQGSRPKPGADASRALQSILEFRELRLGSYKEIVRVIIPEERAYNPDTRKIETRKNVQVEVSSAPVCCLSDIPAAHLGYHAYRYGKFAVGFHRSAAVNHGFNPVLYSLENTRVVRSIYHPLSALELVRSDIITNLAQGIEHDVSEFDDEVELKISRALLEIESEAQIIGDMVRVAGRILREFVAFVKTFRDDEFGTIYCEREWRALKTFGFSYDDLAMIVVPRRVGEGRYFEDFVTKVVPRLKLPRSLPIVPWEDLVEH